MKHLTDDQLSARLDDALPERERAEADAHLAGCEACRARLAEYVVLEESLGRVLAPDPGEAYFADFAERVSARIAAESPAVPAGVSAAADMRAAADGADAADVTGATRAAPRRSPWRWLFSPAGLSLAGSTAVLVMVAGLAWMRFQRHDGADALRTREEPAVPVPDWAAPAPDSFLVQPAPTTGQRAPSATSDAAPPAGASRAREVVTTPSGDEAPARAGHPPKAGPAPAADRLQQRDAATPATPFAEMKRRALIPAQEKQQVRQEGATSDAASGAPAPAPATTSLRAPAPSEAKLQANEMQVTAEVVPPCGTVHDTRGQPIAAAQIVALGGETRATRSGADGRFCMPSLKVGDTLSVWRVGYNPVRVVVASATSLALRMEPISTLGPEGGRMAVGRAQESETRSLDARTESGRLRFNAVAPKADVYASQPAEIRLAAADARSATDRARREGTAGAYERAASRWERIGAMATGQAMYDARFQAIAALREAHRLAPTWDRASHLRARLAQFVAIAPRTLPERDTAVRWQGELAARPKASYR
jgi:hypothetical protein